MLGLREYNKNQQPEEYQENHQFHENDLLSKLQKYLKTQQAAILLPEFNVNA